MKRSTGDQREGRRGRRQIDKTFVENESPFLSSCEDSLD
jgi:hypothetical protein